MWEFYRSVRLTVFYCRGISRNSVFDDYLWRQGYPGVDYPPSRRYMTRQYKENTGFLSPFTFYNNNRRKAGSELRTQKRIAHKGVVEGNKCSITRWLRKPRQDNHHHHQQQHQHIVVETNGGTSKTNKSVNRVRPGWYVCALEQMKSYIDPNEWILSPAAGIIIYFYWRP